LSIALGLGNTFPIPLALSLSKPVLSDAAGGVEGGFPSLEKGKGLRQAQPERFLLGAYCSDMTFWAYMLHCADRSFYVGHSDNLEQRIAQHESGEIPGYTQTRLPIKLVWSQAFGTRMEALEAERQIKGWSRAKKLALIREDWTLISSLARSNKEK
jgi:predicted GIY-YIG superfamily endonuclease